MIVPVLKSEAISHSRRVRSLYRKSLKLSLDWYWQKMEWREKAVRIRAMFDVNKHITNPKQIEHLCRQTEVELSYYSHPQPYIHPASNGGTKWERNTPMPEEVIRRGVFLFDNSS